jgi:hypothetical protein
MNTDSSKPLPRTSLEPVCVAVAAVIRQRRERAGRIIYLLFCSSI